MSRLNEQFNRPEKQKRKFVIIAKVGMNANDFVKYRCNDLDNFFTKFLLTKYPNALFANVFSNRGVDKHKLVKTWGKRKGLVNAY